MRKPAYVFEVKLLEDNTPIAYQAGSANDGVIIYRFAGQERLLREDYDHDKYLVGFKLIPIIVKRSKPKEPKS